MKKKYLLILTLFILSGLAIFFYIKIHETNDAFIDMKIPKGYVEKENLTVTDWKYGISYLKLTYDNDISSQINEYEINKDINKLKINEGLDSSKINLFKQIDQDYVIQTLTNEYKDSPNIYDNRISELLDTLNSNSFICFGYSTNSLLSYYLYDTGNNILHLIRIIS